MKPGASGSLTVAASASSAVLCAQMCTVPTIPHHQWSPACEDSTIHTWLKSHLFSHGPGLTTSWLDSSQRSPDCKERTRLFCLAVVKHGWALYFQEDISVLFMVSKSMNFLIFPLKTKQTGFPAGLWRSMKPVCSMHLQGRKALEKAPLLRTDVKSANVIGTLKSLHGVTSLFLKCNSFILSKFFKRHLYFFFLLVLDVWWASSFYILL